VNTSIRAIAANAATTPVSMRRSAYAPFGAAGGRDVQYEGSRRRSRSAGEKKGPFTKAGRKNV
jgi:hypothetical protein